MLILDISFLGGFLVSMEGLPVPEGFFVTSEDQSPELTGDKGFM
jgi:hypothetical protein